MGSTDFIVFIFEQYIIYLVSYIILKMGKMYLFFHTLPRGRKRKKSLQNLFFLRKNFKRATILVNNALSYQRPFIAPDFSESLHSAGKDPLLIQFEMI